MTSPLPRTTPLPPDVEYCLDAAHECQELDSTTLLTLRLFGGCKDVDGILNDEIPASAGPVAAFVERRRLGCLYLCDYATDILRGLPPEIAGALVYAGFAELPGRLGELARMMSDWAITDETTGGALKPFKRLSRRGKWFRQPHSPTKRSARRLRSSGWIRRHLKQHPDATLVHARLLANRVTGRLSFVARQHVFENDAALRQLFAIQNEQHRMHVIGGLERVNADGSRAAPTQVTLPKTLGPPRSARKLLKRAAVIAAAVLGAPAVSALARGEPITINGPTLALQVQSRGSLADRGHGALGVSVSDQQGTALAQLCVYVSDTPALDQAAAFALYMHAGLESEILQTANLVSVTNAGNAHPSFQARNLARVIQASASAARANELDWLAESRRFCDSYWDETRDLWLEAVSTFVLGSKRARSLSLWTSTDVGAA